VIWIGKADDGFHIGRARTDVAGRSCTCDDVDQYAGGTGRCAVLVCSCLTWPGADAGATRRTWGVGTVWGSAVLDTVIGLAFVFFAVALLSSVVVEWWATIQRKRAKFLLRGVQAMLVDDQGPRPCWWSPAEVWAAMRAEQRLYRSVMYPTVGGAARDDLVRLMAHPLLRAHRQTEPDGRYTRLPAYLPAADFAAALVDVLLDDPPTAQIPQRIDALGPRGLAQSLRALWERSGGDRAAFLAGIASWYEGQMQRVQGWYKRWSKRWIVVVGAVVALVFGIDTLRLAQTFYSDPIVRATVSAAAVAADPAQCPDPAEPAEEDPTAAAEVAACVREIVSEIDGAGLPIGWPSGCPLRLAACVDDGDPATAPDAGDWLAVLVGLALTTVAVSIGAPFWFDSIGRLAPLRNSGLRPQPKR
jgi:hypothetical protein